MSNKKQQVQMEKKARRRNRKSKEASARRLHNQKTHASLFSDWKNHLQAWGLSKKASISEAQRHALKLDNVPEAQRCLVRTPQGQIEINVDGEVTNVEHYKGAESIDRFDMAYMKSSFPGRDLRAGFGIWECRYISIDGEWTEVVEVAK